MFCNKCGNKISEGATFCSKCGSKVVLQETSIMPPQPTPILVPKKESKNLFIGIAGAAIVVIVVIVIALSGGNGGGEQSQTTPVVSSMTELPSPAVGESPITANRIVIGETQSFNDEAFGHMEVTLDYVALVDRFVTSFAGHQFVDTPDEGHIFLYAALTIQNLGTTRGTVPTAWNTVVYNGVFEFRQTSQDGTFDLNPLTDPEMVAIVFMIPNRVAESNGSIVLNFNNGFVGGDIMSFVIRPRTVVTTPPATNQTPLPANQDATAQAVDASDWITVSTESNGWDSIAITIPSTWFFSLGYFDGDFYTDPIINGELSDGTFIEMSIGYLRGGLDTWLDLSLSYSRFLFDDGVNGYMIVWDDSSGSTIAWAHHDEENDASTFRALIFFGWDIFETMGNNEDFILRIARSLTRGS